MDVETILSREKNPFFQHAETEYFLATGEGGRTVGRIAAIRNDAHGTHHPDEKHVGFFGFFECVNDQAVADALFAAAAGWLRAKGFTVMRGPASFSTNDECGLLVDGFDTPPTIMNPHNPRYYVDLVVRAGFAKAMDLLCYEGSGDGAPSRLVEGAKTMAARANVRLRPMNMKRFWEEVELVNQLYNASWEDNWGFIPMNHDEIRHLAKALKPVVVPELAVFAEIDGKPIGFALSLPDFNVALKHNPSGRLFPFGLLRILWYKRKISRLRILILGVLKEYRKTGASVLLYEWTWRVGNSLGYFWGEASWILENNPPMRNALEQMGFHVYKTLRMYDKRL
jgi:GNAT superfamily N-acetyltransferase